MFWFLLGSIEKDANNSVGCTFISMQPQKSRAQFPVPERCWARWLEEAERLEHVAPLKSHKFAWVCNNSGDGDGAFQPQMPTRVVLGMNSLLTLLGRIIRKRVCLFRTAAAGAARSVFKRSHCKSPLFYTNGGCNYIKFSLKISQINLFNRTPKHILSLNYGSGPEWRWEEKKKKDIRKSQERANFLLQVGKSGAATTKV